MSNSPQTERQRILDLAKQGNPQIIAALLNHRLRLQGITVDATVQEHCLSLLLNSQTNFDPEELVSFVQDTLNKLHPDLIQTVQINTTSQSPLNWSQSFEITPLPQAEIQDPSSDASLTSAEETVSLENLSLQPIFDVEDQLENFEDELPEESPEIQMTETAEYFEVPIEETETSPVLETSEYFEAPIGEPETSPVLETSEYFEAPIGETETSPVIETSEYFETPVLGEIQKIPALETPLTNLPPQGKKEAPKQTISANAFPPQIEIKPRVPLTQMIELERFPLAQDLSLLKEDLSPWLESSVRILPPQETSEFSRIREEGQEFLRFQLSHQDTAILPVSYIKEILRISETDILPVPHLNDCVLGIHNWRGEMLWMIDLNRLLGFPPLIQGDSQLQTETAIVLTIDEKVLGIVVQQVDDIERHNLQNLQSPSPSLFSSQLLPFVQGCLPETRSIVLDAPAIMAASVWK